MAVSVDKAWEESYTWENRNIRRWYISFPLWRDRGNTPVICDRDNHIGLQTLGSIDIIGYEMLHSGFS